MYKKSSTLPHPKMRRKKKGIYQNTTTGTPFSKVFLIQRKTRKSEFKLAEKGKRHGFTENSFEKNECD